MSEDFSPGALRNINFMVSMSKEVPEDFFMIPAMQEIATLVDRNEDTLLDADKAVLLGIGALLIREGRKEMVAGLQAAFALRRAADGKGGA